MNNQYIKYSIIIKREEFVLVNMIFVMFQNKGGHNEVSKPYA